jgi:hypothetical protein
MLAEPLARRSLTHLSFGVTDADLPIQVQNVFAGLSLITNAASSVDQIGALLLQQFRCNKWKKWKKLFGGEYAHALTILMRANSLYSAARSEWMQSQNSFNDALVRCVIPLLTKLGLLGPVSLVQSSGQLVGFGTILQSNAPFW